VPVLVSVSPGAFLYGSFMDTTAKLQFLKTRFTADLQIVWMITCKRLVKALYGALIIQGAGC
jgi:hypothetical protein